MRPLDRYDRPQPGVFATLEVVAMAVALFCLAAAVVWVAALACPSPAAAATQIPSKTITASFPSGKPAAPRITSTAAILIDQDTGEILFSHNANARLPNASTTKIMTAVIVLESLELDKKVKISANAVSTIGSKASLQRGEVLTVTQLLYALMVVSGNDASIALAEATAGSVEAFVERMNEKAKELSLTNTHFVNPCGLNNKKHFSSAKDLATLAQYALKNPVFASIVDTIYFSLPPIAAVPPATKVTLRDFDNQNELLKRLAWVNGVKTGSTPYAKYCLVASGSMEGVSLVAVILGAEEDEIRWKEAKSLLEYGISLHPRTLLIHKGETVGEVDVSDYLGRQVRLVAARPLVARLSAGGVATGTVRLDRPLVTPVHVGDVLGVMEFTLNGRSLGSVDLIAAQAVEKPTIRMLLDHWKYLRPPLLRPVD
jgi:serine-type D-Ala-D-Ala carboxypeptidase (penicillin-binding protein 5/6)